MAPGTASELDRLMLGQLARAPDSAPVLIGQARTAHGPENRHRGVTIRNRHVPLSDCIICPTDSVRRLKAVVRVDHAGNSNSRFRGSRRSGVGTMWSAVRTRITTPKVSARDASPRM